ncbi:MAG: hypothetical protein ACYCPV_06320 [Thermoplasmata archaeon]
MSDRISKPRPPALYRAARAIRWVSAILLVLVLIFAGVATYSGVKFAQGVQQGASQQIGGFSSQFTSHQTLELSAHYPINNSGLLPVNGLSIALAVRNSFGVLLTQGSTRGVQIGSGASTAIPFSLAVSVSNSSPAISLLVTDQSLSIFIWANVTYAYLFPVQLSFQQSYSWGAPFHGLATTFGNPFILPNGTVGVNSTLSFSDHLNMTLQGALSLHLVSSGGSTCGLLSYPMDLHQGVNFQSTQTAYLAPGCNPLGGTVRGVFTGPDYSFALPNQVIPQ